MVPVTVPSSIDRQNLRSRTIAIINGAVPTQPNDHRFQSGKANTKSNPEKIASERLLMEGLGRLETSTPGDPREHTPEERLLRYVGQQRTARVDCILSKFAMRSLQC